MNSNCGLGESQEGVTAVIPTYNRKQCLLRVLESYCTAKCVERVVVVDDASDFEVAAAIESKKVTRDVELIVLRNERRIGATASRLRGATVFGGLSTWILFGEDDVLLEEDYVVCLWREARSSGAAAVCGRLIPWKVDARGCLGESLIGRAVEFDEAASVFDINSFSGRFASALRRSIPAPYLHAVSLVRRDVLEECSRLGRFGGNEFREETDLFLRMREKGYGLSFTPAARCFHLRGPLSRIGGERRGSLRSRLLIEFYAVWNTYKLVRDHWPLLKRENPEARSPIGWTAVYAWRRWWSLTRRVLASGFHSSFD